LSRLVRSGRPKAAYSRWGCAVGAQVGLFAIAARPDTEFGSADIDRFKVE